MQYRKALAELLVICTAVFCLITFARIGTSARSDREGQRTENSAVRSVPPGVSTTIATGVTAQQLASAMGIPSGDIVSATILGSPDIRAVGVGQTPLSYFPTQSTTYGILCTGNASNLEVPSATNWSANLDGDDAVTLKVQLKVPNDARCMSFDFAFYSEEFPEYLNSDYNDAFLAEKGQTDIRETNDPVTGHPIISSPYNFAFDAKRNAISVNTAFGISSNTACSYDGVTPLLKAQTPVTGGSTIDIYLTIMDVGDSLYDSAVLLDNFQWSTDASCAEGAKSEGQFLPPDVHQRWTRSIRVDSNGNGRPDEQDETVDLVRDSSSMNYMTMSSQRWGNSVVELSNPDSQSGQFQSVIYRRPQTGIATALKMQSRYPVQTGSRNETFTFNIDTLDPMMRPATFSLTQVVEEDGVTTTKTGQGGAIDTNNDGKPDVFEGEGTGQPKVSLNLVYSDVNGDGNPDFGSIPWSFGQAIGVNTGDGIPDPQVWIPLGDTNGDGVPDAPAFDFDHDNKPDPGLPFSPAVAGPANPPVDYWLHFPQFANGSNFFSQIFMFDLDTDNPATVEVTVRRQDGSLYPVTLNGEAISGQKTYTVPAGGLKILRSSGQGNLLVGSVTVKSNRPLAGVVTYQSPAGAAGVGASPTIGSGFIAPMHRSASAGTDTGVAVMNLGNTPVLLLPELFDTGGVRTAQGNSWTIPPNGQIALMLTTLFAGENLDNFEGVLKVTSDGNLGATVVQTAPGEYATQPVVPNLNPLGVVSTLVKPDAVLHPLANSQDHKLYFAQFANGAVGGASLVSKLFLFNQDALGVANATIFVRRDNGVLLPLTLNGQATGGQLSVTVPTNGLRVVSTNGQGAVEGGSVIVTSDRALSGTLVYGSTFGSAGVGASRELSQGFIAPMETNATTQLNTAIAVMNTTANTINMNFDLCDLSGTRLAGAVESIPGYGHKALFLKQFNWSPPRNLDNFQGLIRELGGNKVAATVIQTLPGQYITMPVAPRLP
ncbi:MAG: choice-of-anchor L domain-containing protein [Acidobacteriota bacterium]